MTISIVNGMLFSTVLLFPSTYLTAASPAKSLACNILPVTVLFVVDFKSIAYSVVAVISLSTIVFSFEFTVTRPLTVLLAKVVFLAAALIVTVANTVLSVATTSLPLIVNDLAVLLMKVQPSVTVKAPSATLLFSTRL